MEGGEGCHPLRWGEGATKGELEKKLVCIGGVVLTMFSSLQFGHTFLKGCPGWVASSRVVVLLKIMSQCSESNIVIYDYVICFTL